MFGYGSNNLIDNFAVLEDEKRRNAPNAELHRGLLIRVNINLPDLQLSGKLSCKLLHNWRNHLAWSTPFSPKIYEDRGGRFQNFTLKIRICYFNRLHEIPSFGLSLQPNGRWPEELLYQFEELNGRMNTDISH